MMIYDVLYNGSVIATEEDLQRALKIVEALLEDADGNEEIAIRRRTKRRWR